MWQGKNFICKMGPEMVLIEMTANVVNVNGGKDLARLIRDLEAHYIVHHKYISVWRHGDPTNRKRLFIVAVHKRHGLKAAHFKFPKEQLDEEWYPVAADVAIPDDQVPARYVRRRRCTRKTLSQDESITWPDSEMALETARYLHRRVPRIPRCRERCSSDR